MTGIYDYFNRDISWLSFDRMVLESALAKDISLRERLDFVSFHSSNLDEFFSVRVAEYRKAAHGDCQVEEVSAPTALLRRINRIVSEQMSYASDIISNVICKELLQNGIMLHFGTMPTDEAHVAFAENYFMNEIIAYLQPLLLGKGTLVFLRDNRPYFALRLISKEKNHPSTSKPTYDYALLKLPINDFCRFVVLPQSGDGLTHVMMLDDIIRQNIGVLFPGYNVDGMWVIKLLRDADLGINESSDSDIAETIRHNLGKRTTGDPAGFYHDSQMPADLLECLKNTFGFDQDEMVACGRYLNLHQMASFPEELAPHRFDPAFTPTAPRRLQVTASLFDVIEKGDFMLHYPYQSFDYVVRLINEAARDSDVTEIKVTQYRVATNSAVVNSLIEAAANNKKVTVFVELKARFDEKNNLEMSDRMKAAGIKIIYSIPGLKVHAKVALILRGHDNSTGHSVAYISTGNFNEQTARCYTDHGLFTADKKVINDLKKLFDFLENTDEKPQMDKLLVSQLNMTDKLKKLIAKEKKIALNGGDGRIVLKVNGIQHRKLIDELYDASLAGVKIDLIVRGICCLIPQKEYSKNISVRRIVDKYLEHGRVWSFGPNGERGLFISSADWLNRNIKRRIEVAVPIENEALRQEMAEILNLQLADNTHAHILDCELNNKPVPRQENEPEVRAQTAISNLIRKHSAC